MTKDKVLAKLLNDKDKYISGEVMSAELGMTRAAVNAAVKILRSEGYDIESSTRRGYKLVNSPDVLNEGELFFCLGEERMKKVVYLDTVDSTNLFMRELAQQGAEDGTVVIAGNQSRGRGRLGRSFISPEGGIYLSWLLRPECAPEKAVNLTAWVSVAAANAIEKVYGTAPGIKWVNDLVMNTKKVCGILTEMSVEGETGRIQYIIVGIGINTNEEEFPPELSDIASSLLKETGLFKKRAELAAELIKQLDLLRTEWPSEKEKYLKIYREKNITTGRNVTLVSGEKTRKACTVGIDDDFALVARLENGEIEHINTGEVSVKGIYGVK